MENKTLESIFKDIDVLGINGGYSVEQLLSPQDCRMLKSTIKDLQERIEKAIEYIEENTCYHKKCNDDLNYDECDKLLEILKGE